MGENTFLRKEMVVEGKVFLLPDSQVQIGEFISELLDFPEDQIAINCGGVNKGFPISGLATIVVNLIRAQKQVTLTNCDRHVRDTLHIIKMTEQVEFRT